MTVTVIYFYAGLYIITKHIKSNFVIFYRCGLKPDAIGQKIVSFKDRNRFIKHMVSGLFYIIADFNFKWEHAFSVHIACAGYKVSRIGVFS